MFQRDRPLRDDIRLLGRLLGDTVRDQEGNESFDLVERIRQSSIAYRRDEDVEARRDLERILDALSREQTMVVVRAFSYFSHLANLAEDLHNVRRARQSEIDGDQPGEGSLVRTLDAVAAAGVDSESLSAFFRDAWWSCADCAPDRSPAQERPRHGEQDRAVVAGA
jgi:phosphoenolpyruvate carboxylase